MNAHRETTYQDAFAVVSGQDRLQEDLEDVANEAEELAGILRGALRKGEPIDFTRYLFKTLQRQLTWLSGDVARMHVAVEQEETHHGR
ncbi:hypothetical protein ACR4XJ_11085 [Nitratidesulfovibrio sp. D1]|uniref:hypothetical protein n=1 Tax=Nitratidesulfovibrio sp. D1 TaxID=3440151 RepID=UPI003EBD9CB3